MQTDQIVVVGASAGGVGALRVLVSTLPVSFPAPICVMLHTSPHWPAMLPEILTRAGPLAAINAADRTPLHAGQIYVAPPDSYLLVQPGKLCITQRTTGERRRSAIDLLFCSAAQVYGPGVIGVILTGNLDDGSAGLNAVAHLGGTAVVQDPEDAAYPAMPKHAIANAPVDYVAPLEELAPLLARLTAISVHTRYGRVPGHGTAGIDRALEQNLRDLVIPLPPDGAQCLRRTGFTRWRRPFTRATMTAMSNESAMPVGTEESTPTAQRARRKKDQPVDAIAVRADAIAERAYERFCERGCEHGHDMEDWLLAERDLLPFDAEPVA